MRGSMTALAAVLMMCVAGCNCAPQHGDANGTPKWDAYKKSIRYPSAVKLKEFAFEPADGTLALNLDSKFPLSDRGNWLMFDASYAKGGARPYAAAMAMFAAPISQPQQIAGGTPQNLTRGPIELKDGAVYSVSTVHTMLPRAWPVIITQYIGLGAEGTRFIVRNDLQPDHLHQQVFLLDGKVIIGDLKSQSPTKSVTFPKPCVVDIVVTLNEDGSVNGVEISDPAAIEGTEHESYVNDMLARAKRLGVP